MAICIFLMHIKLDRLTEALYKSPLSSDFQNKFVLTLFIDFQKY